MLGIGDGADHPVRDPMLLLAVIFLAWLIVALAADGTAALTDGPVLVADVVRSRVGNGTPPLGEIDLPVLVTAGRYDEMTPT